MGDPFRRKSGAHVQALRAVYKKKKILDNHNISYYNVLQQNNISYKKQRIERASEGSLRFFVLPASLSLVRM